MAVGKHVQFSFYWSEWSSSL